MRALVIAVGSLAASGCFGIYGEISDLEDSTVVDESGRPGDVASEDYAIQLAFGGSGGEGLKVTVLGSGPGGVVNLRYDRAGNLDSSGVQLGGDFNDINADVPVAAFPARFADNDSIAVGLPLANGGGRVALFSNSASQIDTKQYRVGAVPVGVALGLTNAAAGTDPGEPDMVVAAGTEVRLFASYPEVDPGTNAPPTTNDFACAVAEAPNGLIAGDVLGADGVDEVAIAVAGTVRVIDASTIEAQSAADPNDCFGVAARLEIAAPGGEADFGKRMLVADLDDSGAADLVIAAPADGRVYIFIDPTDGAPGTPIVLEQPGGFGAAIAAGDLDSDNIPELAVGAPAATVDGTAGAGEVFIFDVTAGGAVAATEQPLSLAGADTNTAYGRSLTVGQFDDVDDLLVVGAEDRVFVYFQHPLPGDVDPRQ